jgi:hypothetical protein
MVPSVDMVRGQVSRDAVSSRADSDFERDAASFFFGHEKRRLLAAFLVLCSMFLFYQLGWFHYANFAKTLFALECWS